MEHFPTKEKLHTDILEQKYGPIHSEVLRHDNVREMPEGADCVREAKLVDEQSVLRTYALTFLDYDRTNKELLQIDDEIREGGLIGKTFREHGYVVKKNVVDVFMMSLSDKMMTEFQVDASEAKARISEFYAKKGDETPIIYGKVLEVYSPDFKDPKDGINEVDRAQVNPVTTTLVEAGISMEETWARLDRAAEENEWDDVQEKFEAAREKSKIIVADLHKKIDNYLHGKS